MGKGSDLTTQWDISEEAAALHADATVCDMTLPWVPEAENKETTLPRFAASGFDFVSLSIGVERLGLGGTLHYLAAVKRKIVAEPDLYVLAHTVKDIREAMRRGKLALGFHFQGTEMLERDTNLVQLFYDLGIRHMLLAKDYMNRAADGCMEQTDSGLSRYGVKLVQEMNRVGMLLDLTHTGHTSTMEAMEVCEAPVIFSHSNPYGVKPHRRNIRDDQIKACAKTGGIIGIVGFGHFFKDNDVSAESLVRNIDYVAALVGPEHVGLGLDFVYYPEQFYRQVVENPGLWPKEYRLNMDGFRYFPPEELPRVTEILMRRGYGEGAIRGILGENLLSVAARVWQ